MLLKDFNGFSQLTQNVPTHIYKQKRKLIMIINNKKTQNNKNNNNNNNDKITMQQQGKTIWSRVVVNN